jgi:hypothetical protein
LSGLLKAINQLHRQKKQVVSLIWTGLICNSSSGRPRSERYSLIRRSLISSLLIRRILLPETKEDAAMTANQEKIRKTLVDDAMKESGPRDGNIDRTAPAGSENSLGAQSVRDGRPATDDSVVEAMDEEGPGITPLDPRKPDSQKKGR